MARTTINEEVSITPLSDKNQLKGVFKIEDPENNRFLKWIKTASIICHRDCSCRTYLACIGTKPVGYMSVSMTTIEDAYTKDFQLASKSPPQVMLIGKLYVDPSYRQKHVGTELIEVAIGIAREINNLTGCLGLIVDANNKPEVIKFYQSRGFKVLKSSGIMGIGTVKMFCTISKNKQVLT